MPGFQKLTIEGVYLVDNFIARDERGLFVKTFHADDFLSIGFEDCFRESYYSQSTKNVLRGMHFQTPPFDHEKLVYVTEGTILDVILDLRKSSSTFGQSISVELHAFGKSIFIPKGCAHGFLTLSNSATVVYNVTTVYNKDSDQGFLWDSFGFAWPIADPIISIRDKSFSAFHKSNSFFS